jgi:hypothetical protein
MVSFEILETYQEFRRDLTKLGFIHDEGDATKFGGMKIEYDREKGIIMVNQKHLIEVGAKRFGITEETKRVPSPMDEHRVITRDDCPKEHASAHDVSLMQSMVGTAGYIATCTRPMLRTSVSLLSRVADNPCKQHLKDATRVLVYVFHTRDVPLVFVAGGWVGPDGKWHPCLIPVSWADSSLANSGYAELRRSHGGFVIMINGGSVYVRCGLQKTVADSSAKAEIIELYNCTREIVYVRHLYEGMGMKLENPTIVHEDNSAAITIMDVGSNSTGSRHMEIKYFWVAEMCDEEVITLKKCDTTLMLADGLTKVVPPKLFHWLEYWLQGLHALPDDIVRNRFHYDVPDCRMVT